MILLQSVPTDRMSTEEYLSVLVSIVVGLGISHLLNGVGNLLVDRARVRFSWPWVSTVLLVFLAHVQFWWSTFGLGSGVIGNFFGFLFFLLVPVTMFLLAVLALPDFEQEGEIDLGRHYFDNHRWFFGIAAVVPALSGIRAVAIEGDPLLHVDRLFEALFILVLLSGALVGRRAYHVFLAALIPALFAAMVALTSIQPG